MSMADKLGIGPSREVKYLGNGVYRIIVTPPAFMKLASQSVLLNTDQFTRYQRWRDGMLIQDALPDLTASQREILMSGIGDEDFHRITKDDEEE